MFESGLLGLLHNGHRDASAVMLDQAIALPVGGMGGYRCKDASD